VTIEVEPPIVSRPYLDLTLDVMARFGMRARWEAVAPESGLRIGFSGRGRYAGGDYAVPPDASSASYLLAAAAVTGGRVTVRDLRAGDPQPDAVLSAWLAAMGCDVRRDAEGTTVAGPPPGALRPFDLDLADAPDLAPTLAVLALFANGPSRFRNAAHLRLKESDRLRALATELGRLGARVLEHDDGLDIAPPASRPDPSVRIETYDDHRIAMAFAIAGLALPGLRIANPACVEKSFPAFWTTLDRLRGA
jgi:3-phosphoshikimate 1-carboxyvinyltransferase